MLDSQLQQKSNIMTFSLSETIKHCEFKFGDSVCGVLQDHVYFGIMHSYYTPFLQGTR